MTALLQFLILCLHCVLFQQKLIIEKEEKIIFISNKLINLEEIKPYVKSVLDNTLLARKMPVTKKKSPKTENALNLAWKVELSLIVSYLFYSLQHGCTCFLKGIHW